MTDDDIRNRLQIIVAELQNCVQQVATVSSQIKELEGTIELLASQEDDRAVYRQTGPLLLEVADRESLAKDLKNTVETLSEHSDRLSQQETTLRAQYEEIVKQFEGS
ncbi:MAG: prefoldin subunit [Candidatus Thalassarchaeaceae archaeon]|jgi:prefoldin beta subunit|nr:prefoldin subunit [Candidatus Thalassarchaeaceae archaeon]MDP7042587.1 prefoldin subunit [Candidatus Thalassarchaeaceae archaeon]